MRSCSNFALELWVFAEILAWISETLTTKPEKTKPGKTKPREEAPPPFATAARWFVLEVLKNSYYTIRGTIEFLFDDLCHG
uniref:Secreted protein n=1 Tax=Caenorhabditis japonica TaxID=281687 RepID=A0A8R1IYS6_CAEJA